jgi:ribosomal protein L7/L12
VELECLVLLLLHKLHLLQWKRRRKRELNGISALLRFVANSKGNITFNIFQVNDGAKYKIIKELREIKPDLSLLDVSTSFHLFTSIIVFFTQTKSLVEKLPSTISENIKKEDGDKIMKKLKDAGGETEYY